MARASRHYRRSATVTRMLQGARVINICVLLVNRCIDVVCCECNRMCTKYAVDMHMGDDIDAAC
eukprot:993302-Lingulodinium_polyedra.AAC.1